MTVQLKNYTKVEIMSLAMELTGNSPITTDSQISTNNVANLASKLYDLLVPRALVQSRWRFAITQTELAITTETPVFDDWTYVYRLPTDPPYLELIRLEPQIDYQIMGEYLFCGASTLKCEYFYYPQPEVFPVAFVGFIIAKIAKYLAVPITEKVNILQALAEFEKEGFGTAAASVSRSSPNRAIQSAPYITVRG